MSTISPVPHPPGLPIVCLLSLLAIVSFPSITKGISLADYHKNLQSAITALDTLSQMDEEESPAAYERRLLETLNAIKAAMPGNQMVEAGEEICAVDNSWLHDQLGEVEKSPPAKRATQISHVLERLRAIEERVAEIQASSDVESSKSAAKERLSGILARPEYEEKGKRAGALARLLRDFFRWLERLLPKLAPLEPGRASFITRIGQIIIIGLSLAVIAYVLRIFLPRLLRTRKRKKSERPQPRIVLGERLEPEESAPDLLSEAEELARNGHLRAAIRKTYIAMLVELGDRNVISLAQHKTNRDYLSQVRNVPALYSNMSRLTDRFERHWYGFASASQADWQEFQAGYLATLQTRS